MPTPDERREAAERDMLAVYPPDAERSDIGTEFVRQIDHPNEEGVAAWETDLAGENTALWNELHRRDTESDTPELTAEEARDLADDLGLQLYRAQDALAFIEECCVIAERSGRTITVADVRTWLKGAQCGRQLATDGLDVDPAAPPVHLVTWTGAANNGEECPRTTPDNSVARSDAADNSALREQLITAIRSETHSGKGPFAEVPRIADAVLAVIRPLGKFLGDMHRDAEADLSRVIDLYEQWCKDGPPPLGTSVSRWWDRRLVELRHAIVEPVDPPKAQQ
jgi:hypothetical protein